jgi:hypothetical protein
MGMKRLEECSVLRPMFQCRSCPAEYLALLRKLPLPWRLPVSSGNFVRCRWNWRTPIASQRWGNFGVDAFAEGHVSQSDLHNSTTSNSLTSQHCATFLIEFVRCLARHLYVQLVFELDRRLRKQQENIMTSFKVVALALLSATASTPAKRRGDSPDGPRPVPN